MAAIEFFSDDISFTLSKPRRTSNWIKRIAQKERREVVAVSYIFCSDAYLLQLNQQYLNHNTLTDIITFDYSEGAKQLEGEIYISIDRVNENAEKFKVSFQDELDRVMIHGVLHLIGYKDKKPADKALMRKKEEASLSLRK
jgi:probable rRNA maturation factor